MGSHRDATRQRQLTYKPSAERNGNELTPDGGCLCGGIRYEITQAPITVYTCHCTDCQHITGSAFAIGVMVLDEALRLSGKVPRIIESIADCGRVKGRCVCPRLRHECLRATAARNTGAGNGPVYFGRHTR